MLGGFKYDAKCLCRKTASSRLFGGNVRREVYTVFWCCRLAAEPLPDFFTVHKRQEIVRGRMKLQNENVHNWCPSSCIVIRVIKWKETR